MVIKDFQCQSCNFISEYYVGSDCSKVKCSKCGNNATWYPSFSRFREDAVWLRSVLEVVDKESNKPHVRAFLQEPTRKNYHRWMKGEGIRPVDGDSDMKKPAINRKEEELAHHRFVDELCKKRFARRAIEVRG